MGPTHCQIQKTALAAHISPYSPCFFDKAECSAFCILSCELGKAAAFLLTRSLWCHFLGLHSVSVKMELGDHLIKSL